LDFPKTISERFRQQNPRLCSLGISCENPRLASNLSRNQRCAMTDTIQRIVLASRPVGEPTLDNFRSEKLPIPQPGPGQMLLRTLWLSLDPYMRGRMSDAPSYAKPVGIGETMEGGTVSEVVVSYVPQFVRGDIVVGRTGWRTHALSDGSGLQKVDPTRAPVREAPRALIGLLRGENFGKLLVRRNQMAAASN
jgi:NADPH-dependent curcumin reductase CurA